MSDETQPSRSRPAPGRILLHALRYGGIAGVIGGAWMILSHVLGLQDEHASIGRWTSLVMMIVPIAAVVLGITSWRNGPLAGRIRFVEAFGVALAIGFVFSVCMGAAAWLQAAVIDPDLIEKQIRAQAALEAQKPDADAAAIEARTAEFLKTATPLLWARVVVFTPSLMLSFFVGLIAAITVPKKKPGLE